MSNKIAGILGVLLIVFVNIVALAGVAFNRSGTPDSVLQLSERELRWPYSNGFDSENSGISLQLDWRLPVDTKEGIYTAYHFGRTLHFLDEAKLRQLGIDHPAQDKHRSMLPSEVLLVLELNGPSYDNSLAQARIHADQESSRAEQHPEDKALQDKAKEAQLRLQSERDQASRLFVVDIGKEFEKLRAAYPDNTRYAILRGEIRLQRNRDTFSAYISQVYCDQLYVPFQFHAHFDESTTRDRSNIPAGRFTMAVGRRLEPWLLSVSKPN